MTILSKRAYPPLLPAFVCLALGILAAVCLPQIPKPLLCLSFAAALALTAAGLGLPRAIGLSAFAAGLWGLVMMSMIVSPDRAGPDISEFADGSPYLLTGRIASLAQFYPLKSRYILNCETLKYETVKYDNLNSTGTQKPVKVTGRIYLSVYTPSDDSATHTGRDLAYGTRVRVRLRLRPIRNFSNPGGFDYERYLRFKGITASAWTKGSDLQLLSGDKETGRWTGVIRRLAGIRQTCLESIMTHNTSRARGDPSTPTESDTAFQAKAVLAAMVIGDKSHLSQSTKDSFARAGVSHLLSISGLHLSIVGFFSYLLFLHLLRPCHKRVVRGQARKIALALTLVPLSVYAVLAGFSPATQRALVMASVFILAMTLEHETDPMNTLLCAGILILAVHPPSLFSISFQLSFSAVGGILVGMAWVTKKGKNETNKNDLIPLSRFWHRVAAAFWVSLFAGIATLPLTAYYFNTVSFIFLVSNLILVPVMGMVCLPIGLLAVALQVLSPASAGGMLAGGILDLVLELIGLCLDIIKFLEALPLAWARVITPSWPEILVYYGMVSAVFALLNNRRRLGIRLMGLAATAGICCAGIGVKQRFFPGNLAVTALDVGQGACTLVITPRGRVILLDCGGFASGSGFNIGRYVVSPYLWRHRIRTIDLVILSHPQADHMNGLGFILDNFTIRQWIRNRDEDEGGFIKSLMQKASARHVTVSHPRYPATHLTYGQVQLWVMPPGPGLFSDLNQNSLVCRLAYGRFSMLFTGDIGSAREKELAVGAAAAGIPLAASVMMVPHHGSRGSGSKILLDNVNPESVIVSCGYRNRYGFPHSDALDRYNTRKIQVYRTDIHGAVMVSSNGSGSGYEINTGRNH